MINLVAIAAVIFDLGMEPRQYPNHPVTLLGAVTGRGYCRD
jgi:hypothetical protein